MPVDISLLVSRRAAAPDSEDEARRVRRGDIIQAYPRAHIAGSPLPLSRRASQFYLHVNNAPASTFRRAKAVLERQHDDFPDPDDPTPPLTQEPVSHGRRRWRIDMSDLTATRRADINRDGETTVNWPTFRNACRRRTPGSRTGLGRAMSDADVGDFSG